MDLIDYTSEAKSIVFSDEGSSWIGDIKDKPEIEQQLFSLQHKYYKTTNEAKKTEIWSEMLGYCQAYAKSLILKRIRGHKYVDPDVVWDRATHAALQFMSQYINRPGFHTGASFAGMLQWKVVEALYKDWDEESHLSLNSIMGENNSELESMQERVHFENVFGDEYSKPGDFLSSVNLHDTVKELLEDFDIGIDHEPRKALLARLYLLIVLKKPKNKHCKQMFIKKWCDGDYVMKKLIDKLMLEFKVRLEHKTD